jgi:hypothetical protein
MRLGASAITPCPEATASRRSNRPYDRGFARWLYWRWQRFYVGTALVRCV